MKIYVAGTVLRSHLQTEVWSRLYDLYSRIEKSAAENGHTTSLPYPDERLDQLSLERFLQEIDNRIMAADSVVTVFYPHNTAVAAESQRAAELGKPQIVLQNISDPMELPLGVDQSFCYSFSDPPLERIMEELATIVAKSEILEEPPEQIWITG